MATSVNVLITAFLNNYHHACPFNRLFLFLSYCICADVSVTFCQMVPTRSFRHLLNGKEMTW